MLSIVYDYEAFVPIKLLSYLIYTFNTLYDKASPPLGGDYVGRKRCHQALLTTHYVPPHLRQMYRAVLCPAGSALHPRTTGQT